MPRCFPNTEAGHAHNHYYVTEDDDVTDGEGSADLGHLYLTVLEGRDICILPVKRPGARC